MSLSLFTESAGVLRRRHYVTTPVGVKRCLLLETGSTNQLTYSEDIAGHWTASSVAVTGGQADPAGGSAGVLLNDSSGAAYGYAYLNCTTIPSGFTAFSVYVKAGTSIRWRVTIEDMTALSFVLDAMPTTLNADGSPAGMTINAGAGTYLGYEPGFVDSGGGLWYRVLFQIPGLTSGVTYRVALYPCDNNVASTGTTYFFGASFESGTSFPSSYIRTTGAALFRNTDLLTIPYSLPPGSLTFYSAFVELGMVQRGVAEGGTPRQWVIGSTGAITGSASNVLFATTASSTGIYSMTHHTGAGSVSSSIAGAPNYRDYVELLGVLYPDGSVQIFQSINGGAITAATRSAANAFGAVWNPPAPGFASGTTKSQFGAVAFLVAPGVLSFSDAQAVARTV